MCIRDRVRLALVEEDLYRLKVLTQLQIAFICGEIGDRLLEPIIVLEATDLFRLKALSDEVHVCEQIILLGKETVVPVTMVELRQQGVLRCWQRRHNAIIHLQ